MYGPHRLSDLDKWALDDDIEWYQLRKPGKVNDKLRKTCNSATSQIVLFTYQGVKLEVAVTSLAML